MKPVFSLCALYGHCGKTKYVSWPRNILIGSYLAHIHKAISRHLLGHFCMISGSKLDPRCGSKAH